MNYTIMIVIVFSILFYDVIKSIIAFYFIDKKKTYEIQRNVVNGVEEVSINFKKHTTISIKGDLDIFLDGDYFFVNNGRTCLLSKDAIHIDGKQIFIQCRKNPLLKKHTIIRKEIERNDQILLELEKEKNA